MSETKVQCNNCFEIHSEEDLQRVCIFRATQLEPDEWADLCPDCKSSDINLEPILCKGCSDVQVKDEDELCSECYTELMEMRHDAARDDVLM